LEDSYENAAKNLNEKIFNLLFCLIFNSIQADVWFTQNTLLESPWARLSLSAKNVQICKI